MFDNYPVVVFECEEDGEKIWKVVFPAISDSKPYHILKENEQNTESLEKILHELLSRYDMPPFPVKMIEILPDEIAKGRDITNISNSWVNVVNYKK